MSVFVSHSHFIAKPVVMSTIVNKNKTCYCLHDPTKESRGTQRKRATISHLLKWIEVWIVSVQWSTIAIKIKEKWWCCHMLFDKCSQNKNESKFTRTEWASECALVRNNQKVHTFKCYTASRISQIHTIILWFYRNLCVDFIHTMT